MKRPVAPASPARGAAEPRPRPVGPTSGGGSSRLRRVLRREAAWEARCCRPGFLSSCFHGTLPRSLFSRCVSITFSFTFMSCRDPGAFFPEAIVLLRASCWPVSRTPLACVTDATGLCHGRRWPVSRTPLLFPELKCFGTPAVTQGSACALGLAAETRPGAEGHCACGGHADAAICPSAVTSAGGRGAPRPRSEDRRARGERQSVPGSGVAGP